MLSSVTTPKLGPAPRIANHSSRANAADRVRGGLRSIGALLSETSDSVVEAGAGVKSRVYSAGASLADAAAE